MTDGGPITALFALLDGSTMPDCDEFLCARGQALPLWPRLYSLDVENSVYVAATYY